ncbi:unnamed protein product [Cylindrotheca closterium]|uniref:DUF6824 domain-containing protein n=1 Tax=Cylindrotheca closterium TaxID=2856 RepID=A0AAD2CS10_9STRA|nr:unnamed protein product [Cylindrotheca closterium]
MDDNEMDIMSWSSEDETSETEECGLDSFESLETGPIDEAHEDLLARALKSITFDEQQSAIHDIHGVSEIQEDPIIMEEKLSQMENEICKIKKKEAYLQAKEISPDFALNKDLRLLFLRSDKKLNAKKAAATFVSHFEVKKKLFGEEKLGRDIMLHDLKQEEWKFCQTRWLQHRDRSGRIVLFWTPHEEEQTYESRFRLLFWSIFTMLRDEESRKNGMVLIFYNVGSNIMPDPKLWVALNDMKKSLPNCFVSFHICYDNPRVRPILRLILSAVGTFLTVRCRSHYGSAKECIYSLLTFGIPREALPITDDGTILPLAEEGFTKRLEQEQQPTPKELVVIIPGRFDVLLGRQKRCQDHVGNLRYRHLVLSYQNDYEQASKHEKTAIAEKVVKEVQANGGHFLEIYYADFIEVSDIVARKKVAHAFRSQRRIQNRRKESHNRLAAGSPPVSGSESDGSVPVFGSQTAGTKRASPIQFASSAKRGFGASM